MYGMKGPDWWTVLYYMILAAALPVIAMILI